MKQGKVISVTPNLASFATPYSSGDVLGSVNKIPGAVDYKGATSLLLSLVVTDSINLKKDIDLVFFSKAPANTVGADNAAYALNDADLPYVLGRVSIVAADYVSSSTNNAEVTLKNLFLMLQAYVGTQDIYFVAVARAAATYTAASNLTFKFGLEQY